MQNSVFTLSIILPITIFGNYGLNINSSNAVYGQDDFINPFQEGADAIKDDLAMALLKDRAEGFED